MCRTPGASGPRDAGGTVGEHDLAQRVRRRRADAGDGITDRREEGVGALDLGAATEDVRRELARQRNLGAERARDRGGRRVRFDPLDQRPAIRARSVEGGDHLGAVHA
jgi:hypothetical protein